MATNLMRNGFLRTCRNIDLKMTEPMHIFRAIQREVIKIRKNAGKESRAKRIKETVLNTVIFANKYLIQNPISYFRGSVSET